MNYLELAPKLQARFDAMVDTLRQHSHTPIQRLGTLVWRLVGNKKAQVVAYNVPTFSFGVFGTPDSSVASFVVPWRWLDQIANDETYCVGGMVFAASQCRDYWNGCLIDPRTMRTHLEVLLRARAWEAEFILTIPDLIPNDYQKEVLDQFPTGLASAPELHYEGRPFLDSGI